MSGPELLWSLAGLGVMTVIVASIAFAVYGVVRRGVASGTKDAGVIELARELGEARARAAEAEAEVARLRERLEQNAVE